MVVMEEIVGRADGRPREENSDKRQQPTTCGAILTQLSNVLCNGSEDPAINGKGKEVVEEAARLVRELKVKLGEITVLRRDCEALPAEEATPPAIVAAVNTRIMDVTKGKVLAARCLPSGDIILTTDARETREALTKSSTWLEVLGQKAKAKHTLYPVMVKGVPMGNTNWKEEQQAIKAIYAQNEGLRRGVQIERLSLRRNASLQAKVGSLVLSVTSPQQANLLVDNGLIIDSIFCDVEIFHREAQVTRCFNCHEQAKRCGFCAAKEHDDKECPARKAGEQPSTTELTTWVSATGGPNGLHADPSPHATMRDTLNLLQYNVHNSARVMVNVYAPPPGGYSSEPEESPIGQLQEVAGMGTDAELVILGDLNVHHERWGGVRVERNFRMAWQLIAQVDRLGLQLATPVGATTWQDRGSPGTTIDLTFLSPLLHDKLRRCAIAEEACKGSDHKPMETTLELTPIPKEAERRNMKNAEPEEVARDCQKLYVPQSLDSRQAVKEYADYLVGFVGTLADKHATVSKAGLKSKTWWSPRVAKAVEEYKQARRSQLPEMERLRARCKRNREIHLAKTANFRDLVDRTRDDPRLMWGLAKWSKERSHLPPQAPTVPPLRTGEGADATVETSFEGKAEALRQRFFPQPEPADLSDTNMELLQAEREASNDTISVEDMESLIQRLPNRKAPGRSGITNEFLKMLGRTFVEAITALTNACWHWETYPDTFKEAKTVALRKPGKADYQTAGAWRPIALLDTIGKIVEAATAKRLRKIAEDHNLLPSQQMGARRGRSTETAIAQLLAQIRTVWRHPGQVASVLSLDMTGAYDKVLRERMVHILRRLGIPRDLVGWVASFMTNRKSTIAFEGQESDTFDIPAGIPQGSPLSPILFLFYNEELVRICSRPGRPVVCIAFVDDVNVMAYGQSTEDNCRELLRMHRACEEWAARHGAVFAPQKYELMHFTRARNQFNLQAELRLPGQTIQPKQVMRVLGVWLDSRLRWKGHLDAVAGKMKTQVRALSQTTQSTWGLPLRQARMVYNMVIRPALTYGAIAWHQPQGQGGTGPAKSGLALKLTTVQNSCLRIVAGAYKRTPTSTLEAETHTVPLDIHLDGLVAKAVNRMKASGMAQQIENACAAIRTRLRHRGVTRGAQRHMGAVVHPAALPVDWEQQWIQGAKERATAEMTPEQRANLDQASYNHWLKREQLWRWVQRWKRREPPWGERHGRPPDKKILKWHTGLRKARSTIIIQLRSGKTGLAAFLNRCKVPEFPTPQCPCRYEWETVEHVLIHCERWEQQRQGLIRNGRLDKRMLLDTKEGLHLLSNWWMESGILGQFTLARELTHYVP
ncbi:predicted protein [Histoplasma mississippiense (nom. inval.)]|uniref:predicted protein n=2 Tax=Ajellomyces capsulatus (strain NAm1 / WU24) TaxID=2059318 RepID=UPI000157D323|nr:predicted protein [Histoplasma mississippiense (nom. inval.)]EDN04478.1 predicted protein [Histoplasma mississippiense (nom. inval.)]